MPGFIAKELCPELVIVPLNFEKYRHDSEQVWLHPCGDFELDCFKVQTVLRLYDPNFDMMSLDEAYLDITEKVQSTGHSREAVVEVGFSGGLPVMHDDMTAIARGDPTTNKTYRKCWNCIESYAGQNLFRKEQTKWFVDVEVVSWSHSHPTGQYGLELHAEAEFVENLPVRKVSGIGKVTERVLQSIGISTCKDVVRIISSRHCHSIHSTTVPNAILLV